MNTRYALLALVLFTTVMFACAAFAQTAQPMPIDAGRIVLDSSLGWPLATLGIGGQVLAGIWMLLNSVRRFFDKATSDGICIRVMHCSEPAPNRGH